MLSQLSYTPTAETIFDSRAFGTDRKLRNIAWAAGCQGLVSKVRGERNLLPVIRTVLADGDFFTGQRQNPAIVLAQRA